MAKAQIKGHVEVSTPGCEAEGCFSSNPPDRNKFCQRSLNKLRVHIMRHFHGENPFVDLILQHIIGGKGYIRKVTETVQYYWYVSYLASSICIQSC